MPSLPSWTLPLPRASLEQLDLTLPLVPVTFHPRLSLAHTSPLLPPPAPQETLGGLLSADEQAAFDEEIRRIPQPVPSRGSPSRLPGKGQDLAPWGGECSAWRPEPPKEARPAGKYAPNVGARRGR